MFAIIKRMNELNPAPAPVELNAAEKLILPVMKAKAKVKGDALKVRFRKEVAEKRSLALLEADKMVLEMTSIMEEIIAKTKLGADTECLYERHSELGMEVERIRKFA
jgi:hypothetical protein